MTAAPGPPGFDDDQVPHDPEHARTQLGALVDLLQPPPRRILDLGCGAGRVLVELLRAGHEVVGVDRSEPALERCRAALDEAGVAAALHRTDFTRPDTLPSGPFDAALCLGNTFMTIADVDEAVAVLAGVAARLIAGGRFVMDDCPADFWPELTEGNWLTGTSDDGSIQLVWAPSDAVFALRRGERVDRGAADLGAADVPLRLWSDGALRLAARAASLSGPERVAGGHLLVMHRGVT